MTMTDYPALADLLFPDVTETPEEMEQRFPARHLPEGAKVTRFAPSPTGYVHFGGLFPSVVGERLAHQSGGVFYLRIEDTDNKREIDGAAKALIETLARYGIHFDEGAVLNEAGEICDKGLYGPYRQSERGPIYHVYAKQLVREGKAYPCFCTKEELERLEAEDKKTEIKTKDWHTEDGGQQERERRDAQRCVTMESVKEHLQNGDPFVLRILADGDGEKRLKTSDLIKGDMELPVNDEDFVLLKSNGIPTYHFAHAVDDHLMRTTHVIRGDEWLSSLPKHLQLFRYLGFRAPKYMHIATIMRLDENGNKKKLSKRDLGANLNDYEKLGYVPEAVREYILTLLNSNFEEWHAQNPDKTADDFPFSIKKMSASGCLFDTDKLNDISKNILAAMSAEEICRRITAWAQNFDPEFAALLLRNPDYAERILAVGRGGTKPRKDLCTLADAREYMGFYYDELFSPAYAFPENLQKEDVLAILREYPAQYEETDTQDEWFAKLKKMAEEHGFAPDMKQYRKTPEAFRGSVADIAMVLRIAITGKTQSPDTYCVMQILGKQKLTERIKKAAEVL